MNAYDKARRRINLNKKKTAYKLIYWLPVKMTATVLLGREKIPGF